MRGVWGNRFRDPGSGHQAWSTLVSNNGLRGPTERYVEPSGADLGSVLGHVGPPPGGSEASRIGCRASFFPLPFLRRRSYRHSRNNCGNSRSGHGSFRVLFRVPARPGPTGGIKLSTRPGPSVRVLLLLRPRSPRADDGRRTTTRAVFPTSVPEETKPQTFQEQQWEFSVCRMRSAMPTVPSM